MGIEDVISLKAYVTRREDFPEYMAVRDRWLGNVLPPCSTLLVVSGFTKAEHLLEVELTASKSAKKAKTAGTQRPFGSQVRSFSSGSAVQDLALEMQKKGVTVQTEAGVVKAKSKDYYWYSPVLRTALKDRVADCVLVPKSEEEVLEIVRTCVRLRLPITTRGAGTGNYGQAVPLNGGAVLDLSELVGFEELRPGVLKAWAGQKMGEIETAMRQRGWELRFFPSTVAGATIGGFVAGGSTGVGGVNYGTLTEPGNVIALRVVTAEEDPRVLELRSPSELLAAIHAYGTNAIITAVEFPLAPAMQWSDFACTFSKMEDGVRCGFALAESPGVSVRGVSLLDGRILELKGFKALLRDVPSLASAGAVLMLSVASNSEEAMRGLVAQFQGSINTVTHRRPLHEYCWNHTTLRALQADHLMTYQQVGYAFEPDIIQNVMHIHDMFADGEMLTHLEWVRLGGKMGCFGLPLQKYTSESRMNEVIQQIEASGSAFVLNPHTYVLEDGGMKQTNQTQLDFKKKHDPFGLLNPGKMRAYEDGQPTISGEAGHLAERLRSGSAAAQEAEELTTEMQEILSAGDGAGGTIQDAAEVRARPAVSAGAMRWGSRTPSWAELSHEDFAELPQGSVAVLPIGAIEQHGPHLPTGVDSFIAAGILERSLDLLPEEIAGKVVVMPLQAVGTSNEHLAFRGTISIEPQSFIDLLVGLGKSVKRAGLSKMLVLNAHGGQVDASNIAARRLRVEADLLCCVLHTFRTWRLDGMWPDEELRYGIHGGGVETSMIMHLQGDLVRNDKFQPSEPRAAVRQKAAAAAGDAPLLHPHSPGVMYGWMAHDLGLNGAVGNMVDADAERGRQVVEDAASSTAKLLSEFVAAETEDLLSLDGPSGAARSK
eukprot:TRINITY_DN106737_c0_g1_i1.p1 TRINITY_DN106737_c0_g1~~TRINITY_DN106737_c0_g1_i1.p1  ORF type:complete len:1015 (+),score=200.55 TRINITY_DN106737_c0_g1_i1:401-3046(+)